MPRKRSFEMKMQEYPPLSTRAWHVLLLQAVRWVGRTSVQFELEVADEPQQVGRKLTHTLPAALSPNSPLQQFLAEGFGIRLTEGQTFNLLTLVGHRVLVRFDKGVDGTLQAIVAVRPCPTDPTPPTAADESSTAEEPEETL